jgi:hypothetical protein
VLGLVLVLEGFAPGVEMTEEPLFAADRNQAHFFLTTPTFSRTGTSTKLKLYGRQKCYSWLEQNLLCFNGPNPVPCQPGGSHGYLPKVCHRLAAAIPLRKGDYLSLILNPVITHENRRFPRLQLVDTRLRQDAFQILANFGLVMDQDYGIDSLLQRRGKSDCSHAKDGEPQQHFPKHEAATSASSCLAGSRHSEAAAEARQRSTECGLRAHRINDSSFSILPVSASILNRTQSSLRWK